MSDTLRVKFDRFQNSLEVTCSEPPDSELCRQLTEAFRGFSVEVPIRKIELRWSPELLLVSDPMATMSRLFKLRFTYTAVPKNYTRSVVESLRQKVLDVCSVYYTEVVVVS